jgi:hypothetical protein
MFSLKHYYYGPPTGNSKFKSSKEGNTFSAAIEQVKILQTNTVAVRPHGEPTMKSVQRTPPSHKGKSSIGDKRPNLSPLQESSPSPAKKKKREGESNETLDRTRRSFLLTKRPLPPLRSTHLLKLRLMIPQSSTRLWMIFMNQLSRSTINYRFSVP